MINLTSAEIYLRKSLKVALPVGDDQAISSQAATLAKNWSSLGFGVTPKLFEALSGLSLADLVKWDQQVTPVLREMVGADREYRPIYPNFPKQVMDASDAELFFNAVTHYFGFVISDLLDDPNYVVLPHYEKELRPLLDEQHNLRWIHLGDEGRLQRYIHSTCRIEWIAFGIR